MRALKSVSLLFVILLTSSVGHAALFQFPVLDTTMTEPIFRTLGAGLAFRSVEPAAGKKTGFGFNIGVSATAVRSSAVSTILEGVPAFIPAADFQVSLNFPVGISVELGFLPGVPISGTTLGKYGGMMKWTLSETAMGFFPFDVAFRAGYCATSLSTTQNLSGATVVASYSGGLIEAQLQVGKAYSFFEPYLGLGVVSYNSTISASGSTQLFGNTFAAGTQSVSGKGVSVWPQAGFLIRLPYFGFALEYNNMFGLDTLGSKFSVRF